MAGCNEEDVTIILFEFLEDLLRIGILFDTLVMGSHCQREVLELHTHYT
jgi:hypothetical protein